METIRHGFWSPLRFGRLLLREILSGYRSLLIAAAAVGGMLLLVSALSALGIAVTGNAARGGSGEFYTGFFQNLLFIGGLVVSSFAFRELWQPGGGIFYLTLPGSHFEKLASKLLVTSVGYAVGSTLFFTAVTALSELLNRLLFGVGHGFFNPLDPEVLWRLLSYLVVQSMFLLGSVWFKKLAFVRTVLWLVIFAVIASIVAAVAGRIAMGGHYAFQAAGTHIGRWSFDLRPDALQQLFLPGTRANSGLMGFKIAGQVVFYLLAPVCWLAAYFRLEEVEV